jgi:nitrogen fixation NifU-like protein
MMSDLTDLYQELIIDHNRRPRNRSRMEHATCSAQGYNPLCGDKVSVFVKVDDGRVADISFEGSGCAISTASASMMTEILKGKTVDEAKALFAKFHHLITGEGEPPAGPPELGKLMVFSGVCQYPARVKCATLAWHTMKAAVEREAKVVTTE